MREALTSVVISYMICFLQVEVNYNIDDDDQKRSFLLTTTLPRETMNDYDVRVCTRYVCWGVRALSLHASGEV